MKRFLLILLLFCSNAFADLTDIKFGQSQIADSQWNVSACLYTTTCQIYSKSPGTMYKIPWYTGQWSWQAGQYVQFSLTGDATNPYEGKVYNSDGTLAGTIGTGHIVNMGPDYFFFVGNDNDTGQLFSGSSGMSSTAGVTWTGTLNPTIAQANAYANANYSTVPLAAGQTASTTPSSNTAPPAPTAIYRNSPGVYITRAIPTTSNSPGNEGPLNAFDNNVGTKYLNFDKKNAGVTVQLNTGRAVTGFTITTANDFSGRDPTSYKLYGSNDGSTWTLIKEDTISLSETRYWTSPMIDVGNTTAYAYYFMLFPTTKAGEGCGLNCDSMQVAEITYYYDANSTATSTASSSTIVDPVTAAANTLCCGGSASPFSADATNTFKVQSFLGRNTNDSKVYIEQIGNSNTITVEQTGTRQNYAEYNGNGSFNDITITQSGNSQTQVNYAELNVNGSSNIVNITQQSSGGSKGAFVNIQDNNNTVTIHQKDSGSHYTELTLSGGNKNVDVLQQGSANHMAKITLSGLAQELSLTQSGSTQQFYSITTNCATAGGCAKITVNQGN